MKVLHTRLQGCSFPKKHQTPSKQYPSLSVRYCQVSASNALLKTSLDFIVSVVQHTMARDGVCKFYLQGRCTWGDSCNFRHQRPGEAPSGTDDGQQQKLSAKRTGAEGGQNARHRNDSLGFVVKGMGEKSAATHTGAPQSSIAVG